LKASIAVLGNGELSKALTVSAHRFTESAKAKIEAVGGKAEVLLPKASE
jgi:large subunit ribosomal protein L15